MLKLCSLSEIEIPYKKQNTFYFSEMDVKFRKSKEEIKIKFTIDIRSQYLQTANTSKGIQVLKSRC